LLQHLPPAVIFAGIAAIVPIFGAVRANVEADRALSSAEDAKAALNQARAVAEQLKPLISEYKLTQQMPFTHAVPFQLDFDKQITDDDPPHVSQSEKGGWQFIAPTDGHYVVTGFVDSSLSSEGVHHNVEVRVNVDGKSAFRSFNSETGTFFHAVELRKGQSVSLMCDVRWFVSHESKADPRDDNEGKIVGGKVTIMRVKRLDATVVE